MLWKQMFIPIQLIFKIRNLLNFIKYLADLSGNDCMSFLFWLGRRCGWSPHSYAPNLRSAFKLGVLICQLMEGYKSPSRAPCGSDQSWTQEETPIQSVSPHPLLPLLASTQNALILFLLLSCSFNPGPLNLGQGSLPEPSLWLCSKITTLSQMMTGIKKIMTKGSGWLASNDSLL